MTNNADFDIKQLVSTGAVFGPREIDQLRESISEGARPLDELKEAINELKTKSDDELSPAARVKLGVCMFLIGNYDAAYASLKKGDGGALVQYYFAKLHSARGEYDEAIQAYNTAQTAGYNSDDCVLGRAEVYRKAEKIEESLNELNSLSGAVEQTAEYLYQRGATVYECGDVNEAIALYERAVAVDPKHPGALFGLALENERRGNDDEALGYYQVAAKRFPADVGTLINLAILYEDREDYTSAQQCLQRVLSAYPTNEKARLYLKDVEASLEMHYDEEEILRERALKVKYSQSVFDMSLSERPRNCLEQLEVKTVGDLCKLTEQDLLACRNFGETSLREIEERLNEMGLQLGMLSPDKRGGDLADLSHLSPEKQSQLETPVEDMGLSVRAKKCMRRLGIQTLRDLISRTAETLLETKNFGVTSLKEVRDKLAERGLHLKGDPPVDQR
ncbi:MAG: DNA-directed RNA polymerase subunit alpha C-terminal domain-containing protein [Thermoguttaceae bacterium]|jgi:DNA-directed RNA polymerase subunit alpha